MSVDRCQVVQRALLEGDHDHDHLQSCPHCARVADALAAVDAALARGPRAERAPDLVAPVIDRLAARPRRAAVGSALLGGAFVLALVTVWSITAPTTADSALASPAIGAVTGGLERLREHAPVGSAMIAGLYAAAVSLVVRVAAAEI